MDFKLNDTVLYGADGVCRISEITEIPIGNEKAEYYVLRPVYDEASKIMIPVKNEKLVARIKHVLSKEDICSAFDKAAEKEYIWEENDTKRKEVFKNTLEYGEISEKLRLLCLLYSKRSEKEKSGKKMHIADERILKELEKVLFEELSLGLGMRRTEVKEFVKQRLNINL